MATESGPRRRSVCLHLRVEAPMARRSFYVIDIVEILVHWYAGRSQHELAASLGVDRKTIRK